MLGNYMLIVDSGNRLGIYNKNGVKIVKDSIELNWDKYYSKCCMSSVAYDAKITGNTIEINVFNGDIENKDYSATYTYNLLTGEKIK